MSTKEESKVEYNVNDEKLSADEECTIVPSSSPTMQHSISEMYLNNQFKLAHNHILWLYTDILYHIITVKCPCGALVGLDKYSMTNFMVSIKQILSDLSYVVIHKKNTNVLNKAIEIWLSIIGTYERDIFKALRNTHLDKNGMICEKLFSNNVESNDLMKRLECIYKLGVIFNDIMSFNVFELNEAKHANMITSCGVKVQS